LSPNDLFFPPSALFTRDHPYFDSCPFFSPLPNTFVVTFCSCFHASLPPSAFLPSPFSLKYLVLPKSRRSVCPISQLKTFSDLEPLFLFLPVLYSLNIFFIAYFPHPFHHLSFPLPLLFSLLQLCPLLRSLSEGHPSLCFSQKRTLIVWIFFSSQNLFIPASFFLFATLPNDSLLPVPVPTIVSAVLLDLNLQVCTCYSPSLFPLLATRPPLIAHSIQTILFIF